MQRSLLAHEGKIDGIAEQAVAGAGASDEIAGYVDRRENAVDARQDQVSKQRPEGDRDEDPPPPDTEGLGEAQVREPQRRDAGEHEEEPVERDSDGVAAPPFSAHAATLPPLALRIAASPPADMSGTQCHRW